MSVPRKLIQKNSDIL